VKEKLTSIVLAVLLMGLVLPGCVSKAELDKCKDLVAERAAQTEKQAARIDELEVQIVALNSTINSTIEAKDAQIAELQEEVAELKSQLPQKPTYQELSKFLEEDDTHRSRPPDPGYTWNYNLLKNAKEKGIKGHVVFVLGRVECNGNVQKRTSGTFAGFYTADRGLVYVAVDLERIVKLEKGKDYFELNDLPPTKRGCRAILLEIYNYDF